ncbi:MAG: hypothetical protein MN733_30290 [Nitrososphaera sp.]|nr:hypothetical protein [Nitrososphaera sp.]
MTTEYRFNTIQISIEANNSQQSIKLAEDPHQEFVKVEPGDVVKQHVTGTEFPTIVSVCVAIAGSTILSSARCPQPWLVKREGVVVEPRMPDGAFVSLAAEKFGTDGIVCKTLSLPSHPTPPPDILSYIHREA